MFFTQTRKSVNRGINEASFSIEFLNVLTFDKK